jgi:porin
MIQFLRCSSAFSVLLIGSLSSILAVPASAIESQERSPSELDLSPQTEIVRPISEVSSQKPKTTDRAIALTTPPPLTENNLPKLTFNQGNAKDLTPLTPRNNNLDSGIFDLDHPLVVQDPATTMAKPEPSKAINLLALRAFKKPVGAFPLDTGVRISGIRAKDPTESFWTRDYLTGNWGGLRDRLRDEGIDITLAHFFDGFGVISGGKQQATSYEGATTISFDFYTGPMKWWENGQIHWTMAVLDNPVSVGRNYAGSLSSVYTADPIKSGFRLFELWYGQKFPESNLEVRLGKIYQFVKFASLQSSSIFQNSSFNFPHYIGTTPSLGYSIAYGIAPFGLQVLYDPNPEWSVYAGLMDGFDDPTGGIANLDGTSIGLDLYKKGVEGIVEVGYHSNQRKGDTGLPGNFKLGFQFHTGLFDNNSRNQSNGSLAKLGGIAFQERGNYALYLTAEQMIYRESPDPENRTQGLNAFLKAVYIPREDINQINWSLAGGLAYAGLFPGRDRDVTAIGISRSLFNNGIREFDRESLDINPSYGAIRDAETVVEALHAFEIAPWWVAIASLQYIFHPGGFSSTPNAIVFGISNRIAF